MKNKILLIHRYFWPDTPPYANMLRSISEFLVKKKFEVSIFSSIPFYNLKKVNVNYKIYNFSKLNSVNIIRVKQIFHSNISKFKNFIDIIIFSLQIFFYILLRSKVNVVMISTSPPIISPLLAVLACKIRRFKFIYHCMDIHPEIAEVNGNIKNNY